MATRRKPAPDPAMTGSMLADALRDSAGHLLEAGLEALARAGPDPGRLLRQLLEDVVAAALERQGLPARAGHEDLGPRLDALDRRLGALDRRLGALERRIEDVAAAVGVPAAVKPARRSRVTPATAAAARPSPGTSRRAPTGAPAAGSRRPPARSRGQGGQG